MMIWLLVDSSGIGGIERHMATLAQSFGKREYRGENHPVWRSRRQSVARTIAQRGPFAIKSSTIVSAHCSQQ